MPGGSNAISRPSIGAGGRPSTAPSPRAANRLQKPNAKLVSTAMMLIAMRCATISLASWRFVWDRIKHDQDMKNSTQWWSSLYIRFEWFLNDVFSTVSQTAQKAQSLCVESSGPRAQSHSDLTGQRCESPPNCPHHQPNGRILRKLIGSETNKHSAITIEDL